MLEDFIIMGNLPVAIRSDEEMTKINKEEADNAFKFHKKILDEYLKKKGFFKYKTNSYIRENGNGVLEYINLQKECYGSKSFTVNCEIISLYVPHKFFCYDLGKRLGCMICDKDIWWDYADESIAKVSFENVTSAIEKFLLPRLEELKDDSKIKEALLKEKHIRESYGGCLSDIQQAWLDVIDDHSGCDEIIRKNVEIFKLPARLVQNLNLHA